MNQLFIKQELDSAITKEQFLEDMDYLFENLRKAYGMYDYFGEDAFFKARVNVGRRIRGDYEFEMSHAIKYTSWEGVPVIDCKKCYYDNKIEKEQLEEFAKKGLHF